MIILLIISIIILLSSLFLFIKTQQQKKRLIKVDEATKQYNDELKNKNTELVKENNDLLQQYTDYKKKNDSLNNENNSLNIEIDKIRNNIVAKQEQLEQVINNIELTTKSSEDMSRKAFINYCDILDKEYQNREKQWNEDLERLNEIFFQKQTDLDKDYEQKKETIEEEFKQKKGTIEKELEDTRESVKREIDQINEELAKLKATRAAAMEAKLREQEIKEKLSFYCLQIKKSELEDIKVLKRIEENLHNPRPLYMLIWTNFFRTPTNTLCSNVIGSTVKTGIYKITNQLSGICYIGQATDLRARWIEHIKLGLGIDTPANNKLYRAMMEDGVWNFSFEVLEECKVEELNSKEKYYIELYDSKNHGYNTLAGINK